MSIIPRRSTLLLGLAIASIAFSVHAQMPPLIKLVVPYPPGGSVDTLARLIQQPLQDALKTTVVVDNRPGAGGRIAASQVKREAANGSVILIAPNSLTTIQSLVYADKLDYKITDDFVAVSRLASYPFGLAVPGTSSTKTVAELTAAMKVSPNPSYGTSGAGGMAHFTGLVFGRETGIDWTHIAFKGGAPLVSDLIGGHLPAGIDTLIDQIEHQRAGKIRVIGIFSDKRYSLAPEIPTLAEQGVKMGSVQGWFGAFMPAKTPKDIVNRVDRAFAQALASQELNGRLTKMVIESAYMPSTDFTRLQVQELQQWAPVVRESGFKPE